MREMLTENSIRDSFHLNMGKAERHSLVSLGGKNNKKKEARKITRTNLHLL